eukprot:gene4847-6878_t
MSTGDNSTSQRYRCATKNRVRTSLLLIGVAMLSGVIFTINVMSYYRPRLSVHTLRYTFVPPKENSKWLRNRWDICKKEASDKTNNMLCRGHHRPLYTISHPKSGRTWMRCLVGSAYACNMKNKTLTLGKMVDWSEKVLNFNHGNPHPFEATSRDIINGFHMTEDYKRKRGIIIVRDPRDVIVSSYYERLYRDSKHPIPGSMSIGDYLQLNRGSLKTLLMFLNVWSIVEEKPGWLILRYEDVKECPVITLDYLLNYYMCLDIASECISFAVQRCDFSTLQTQAEHARTSGHGSIWAPKAEDENSRKVRKGKVGGYRSELSWENITFLEATIKEHLLGGRIFGYGDPS